ncbi:molybdenum cofactor biosynthesis protein B [Saccharospirillum salsuginis]|uniref:Molybdenum cofactor biosynthesis protein B n=1 Tax=Saccharospirillum salsuginis TaxID=418750 RepID=A0A918JZD9_9GAMM|nr:molybdenum cofactor biosynthesis protein B [Saccharospirillum salsuginis]GGX38052.1 molybdenum cofactor biosynthesis protein B [Saccharospirillum salsuginis]
MSKHTSDTFEALNLVVLTVSDTRDESNDTSGQFLADKATTAGHTVIERCIEKDDVYQIRHHLSRWIASADAQVVVITGGTGFTGRDSTPEAVKPLFDKEVEGFGELFRQLSYEEIGTSTVQSRALAGMANGTLVFCLPGSTSACRTAWERIIEEQLDARQKPCNFVAHLKAVSTEQCESRG